MEPNLPPQVTQPVTPPVPPALLPESVPVPKKSKKKLVIIGVSITCFFLLIVLTALLAKNKLAPTTPAPTPTLEAIIGEEPVVEETASPSATPTVDFSKWKTWNDPNGFTLLYPPKSKAKHLNESTIIETKGDKGLFTVSFCKNCVKDACTGTCNQEKDIVVAAGEQKYAEKQIWPDNNGNFNFRLVIAYPNTYTREKLVIFGNYPDEKNLEEIQTILSTFQFTK